MLYHLFNFNYDDEKKTYEKEHILLEYFKKKHVYVLYATYNYHNDY